MASIYVMATSKKALNEQLKAGPVFGIAYDMFTEKSVNLADLPLGTAVKIFSKYVGGSPYAKAYGQMARDKNCGVIVK